MKLSVCSIVKNEVAVISRMIDSVLDIADQIVILDTGSTDETLDVLHKYNLKYPNQFTISSYNWTDDFSAARNASLELATGDWVLILDADEFLDAKSKSPLRPYLAQTNADAVFIPIRSYTGTLKEVNMDAKDMDAIRLFRNRYRYRGAIHEQIIESIQEANGRFERIPMRIHHIGYTDEYIKLKQKQSRNIKMLEKQLLRSTSSSTTDLSPEDRMHDWFDRSNLLPELMRFERWQEAADEANSLLYEFHQYERSEWPVFISRVYNFLVICLRELRQFDKAIEKAQAAIQEFPSNPELIMQQAVTEISAEYWTDALNTLTQCMNMSNITASMVEYSEGTVTYHSLFRIGFIWMHLGEPINARDAFVQCYQENPEFPALIWRISALTQNHQVMRNLERTIRTPQRYREFIESYSIGGWPDAIEFIERYEKQWGQDEVSLRARFAFARHNHRDTINTSAEAVNSKYELARIGLYCYENGDFDAAMHWWLKAEDIGDYLTQVCRLVGTGTKWEIKGAYSDLLAVNASHFVRDHIHLMGDRKDFFPIMQHGPLLAYAWENTAFMQDECISHLEAEWKSQAWMSMGHLDLAKSTIEQAKLPHEGYWSVRGSLIYADLHPEQASEILEEALKLYPASHTLRYVKDQISQARAQ